MREKGWTDHQDGVGAEQYNVVAMGATGSANVNEWIPISIFNFGFCDSKMPSCANRLPRLCLPEPCHLSCGSSSSVHCDQRQHGQLDVVQSLKVLDLAPVGNQGRDCLGAVMRRAAAERNHKIAFIVDGQLGSQDDLGMYVA